MDRPQLHRWLARAIAGVLGVGVFVAAVVRPGEVPTPPMRMYSTPELDARCSLLAEVVGGGVDTSDLAGVEDAVPPFDLDGDVGRRIVPPSQEEPSGDVIRFGDAIDRPDESATIVLDVVRYHGTLGDLRRAFAEQADELGWSTGDGTSEERQRGLLFDFLDTYERPDGPTVVREGTGCSGVGWFGLTRTVVPISRTGPCAPPEVQARCERVLELSNLGGGSGFAELSGHTLTVDAAGAASVTYHLIDDWQLGSTVSDFAEALEAEGWTWTNRPPPCPVYEYDPFSFPRPPAPPPVDESQCFDDFEQGNLLFWDIPIDRPTQLTFNRTLDGAVQTIDATFTPVLGSDAVDGMDSNDIEAGYDATIVVTEAPAPA